MTIDDSLPSRTTPVRDSSRSGDAAKPCLVRTLGWPGVFRVLAPESDLAQLERFLKAVPHVLEPETSDGKMDPDSSRLESPGPENRKPEAQRPCERPLSFLRRTPEGYVVESTRRLLGLDASQPKQPDGMRETAADGRRPETKSAAVKAGAPAPWQPKPIGPFEAAVLEPTATSALCVFGLTLALSHCDRAGLFCVHGALLMPPGEGRVCDVGNTPGSAELPRGLLLFAPNRGGKSTLAATLVARGWTCLGDDVVGLRAEENGHGGQRVVGVCLGLPLRPRLDGLARAESFADVDRALVPCSADDRYHFAHQARQTPREGDRAVIARVVFATADPWSGRKENVAPEDGSPGNGPAPPCETTQERVTQERLDPERTPLQGTACEETARETTDPEFLLDATLPRLLLMDATLAEENNLTAHGVARTVTALRTATILARTARGLVLGESALEERVRFLEKVALELAGETDTAPGKETRAPCPALTAGDAALEDASDTSDGWSGETDWDGYPRFQAFPEAWPDVFTDDFTEGVPDVCPDASAQRSPHANRGVEPARFVRVTPPALAEGTWNIWLVRPPADRAGTDSDKESPVLVLNATGALLWEELERPRTLEDLADVLAETLAPHGAETGGREDFLADARALVENLVRAGLARRV